MTSSLSLELRLLIARHGESSGNVAGVVQGAGLPSELTEHGRAQATRLRARLDSLELDHVFCSDQPRAVQTAQLALPGRAVELRADLRERSAGVLEGEPLGAVELAAARAGQKARQYRPAGGESWLDVRERASCFLQELLAATQRSRTVLLVSHGGYIRELVAAALQLSTPTRAPPQGRVGNTSLSTLVLTKEQGGRWRCSACDWNDTSHCV